MTSVLALRHRCIIEGWKELVVYLVLSKNTNMDTVSITVV